MALKKVKGNIERMFDKNLTDLVRGIRNNKENEVKIFTNTFYTSHFDSITIYFFSGEIHFPVYGRYQAGAETR